MKHFILFLVAVIGFPISLFAQNNYFWSEKNISINSPIKLHDENYSSNLVLSAEGIKIEFSTIGGMEGIVGLTGSLESYASAFAYTSVGNAEQMNGLNNLYAARISAQKNNKNVIICMFATTDYKQHFTCEITFSDNKLSVSEAIVNSISYGSENIVVNQDDNNNNNQNQQTGSLKIGSVPPDFALTDVNGDKISLSGLKGKVVLLDFWGTWCAPCIKSIPELKELYSKHQKSGFEILSIASDNDKAKWKALVDKKGMIWKNVIDITDKVVELYDIEAFPTLMLIDKNGKLVSLSTSISEVDKYLNINLQNNNNTDDNKGYNANNNVSSKVKNTHFGGSAIENKTWQLLADYSTEAYIILDEFYAATNEYQGHSVWGDSDFTIWIDGKSEHDLVKSTNTVVHEVNHGYTGKLYLKMLKDAGKSIGNNDYSVFYLGNRQARLVEHAKVYETSEMNTVFPKNLITLRYETYVYPSESIMGSQQYGVYGLLDELNAYYWGTKTSFDFYEYYNTKYNSAEGWGDFFYGIYGTYYAYLEFKSYILVYMIYAKQNHKDVYDGIMEDEDFLYAFKQVDENWTDLILQYNKLKDKIIATQKNNGLEISETDEFMIINGMGSGTFMKTYNIFKDELKKDKYEIIAKAMGLKTASGPDM